MIDVSRTLSIDDFWRWHRATQSRKIRDRYNSLLQLAHEHQVDVTEAMAILGFDSLADFAIGCPRFSLRCGLNELSELGAGCTLYFYYLRFMMLVLLLFSILNLPVLLEYGSGESNLHLWSDPTEWPQGWRKSCQEMKEQRTSEVHRGDREATLIPMSWMSQLSPGNLGPEGGTSAIIPCIVVLGPCLLAVCIFLQYTWTEYINKALSTNTPHPNDFAVLVHGLPPSVKEERSVKKWFRENAIPGRNDVEVASVVFGWDISSFKDSTKMKHLRQSTGEAIKQRQDLSACLENDSVSLGFELKSSEMAVVVFRKHTDQMACLENWQGSDRWWSVFTCSAKSPFFLDDANTPCSLTISRAPDPTDIKWENAGKSLGQRIFRKALTRCTMLLLLGVSYILVLLLTRTSQRNKPNRIEISSAYMGNITVSSMLPRAAIATINALLMLAARWFSVRECHLTATDEAAAMTNSMSVAMVINASVVLWNAQSCAHDWYSVDGLVTQVNWMLAINFCLPPLMFLMDYDLLVNWWMRRRLTRDKLDELNRELDKHRNSEEPAGKEAFREARERVKQWLIYFEPTPLDEPQHYANAEKTFVCCILYMPLVPWAPIVGFFSLIFQYANDKWMLLRYCRRPPVVQNAKAAFYALDRMRFILPCCVPITMTGFLLPSWSQHHRKQLYIALFCSLAMALFLISLPIRSWARKASDLLSKDAYDHDHHDYYEAQYSWPTERKYHKSHLLYRSLDEASNPENLAPREDEEILSPFFETIESYGLMRQPVTPSLGLLSVGCTTSFGKTNTTSNAFSNLPVAKNLVMDTAFESDHATLEPTNHVFTRSLESAGEVPALEGGLVNDAELDLSCAEHVVTTENSHLPSMVGSRGLAMATPAASSVAALEPLHDAITMGPGSAGEMLMVDSKDLARAMLRASSVAAVGPLHDTITTSPGSAGEMPMLEAGLAEVTPSDRACDERDVITDQGGC
eukprot:TRINITY_DN4026_c0_g5_i3.p1 TRINITY_DN4026_c0_g5~~TRINITY_DN4026_c0_g5_i3.p1  ORF type:complete len:972 (-),score=119.55 TRINITY_DN4026_c0_g5_i3:272-3187(-)